MEKASEVPDITDDLTLRLWDGDRSALNEILAGYAGQLERVIALAFPTVSTYAEDIVAEAFLRFWQSRNNYDGKRPLRAYIYRIAENVARNLIAGHLKWQKSRNREQPLPDDFADLHPDPRPIDSALNEVEKKQEGICLALSEVLGLVPEIQREVLVAYGLAGDYEVSAAQLGVDLGHKFNNGVPIPAGTIRQYKRRAKEKVDAEMRKRGYDLSVVEI